MKKILIAAIVLTVGSATVASAADGKEIYEKHCLKCHGAEGKGDTKIGQKIGCKDYSKEEIKEDAGIKAVKEGVKDAGGKQVMKPVEGLSDDDAKAVVAYMRSLKK